MHWAYGTKQYVLHLRKGLTMYRYKVYDKNGLPLAACKTYKSAEKARIEYLKRTSENAYIVDMFSKGANNAKN
jgi:hypothetical protein